MNKDDSNKLKSYDLTQGLAFFVIGIEVAFCGYLLLAAKEFYQYKYYLLSLFLVGSFAAVFGILWRYKYNIAFFLRSNKDESDVILPKDKLQPSFVIASIILAIIILVFGSLYIISL